MDLTSHNSNAIACASSCSHANHYLTTPMSTGDTYSNKILQEGSFHHSLDAGSSFQLEQSKFPKQKYTSKQKPVCSKLQFELSQYQRELSEYTNATKDLQEKCFKINCELKEMQAKHSSFMTKRSEINGDCNAKCYSDSSINGSELSLRRKYTQVFHHGHDLVMDPVANNIYGQKHSKSERISKGNKENECSSNYEKRYDTNLRSIYKTFKTFFNETSHNINQNNGIALQIGNEEKRLRNIVKQQRHCLADYEGIMKTQQNQIDKLNSNNIQLETEFTVSMDQLRRKMENKLEEVAQLPHILAEEQTKNQRIFEENVTLNDRIRNIQAEVKRLKLQIEEMGRRKMATMARLKNAERDLKIFKNYNVTLKQEKCKLNEEIQKMQTQMHGMQNSNKQTMTRQRDQGERQRRELQKRVQELELQLRRSQNSSTNLMQDRDKLITELQTQLNACVHNFEVSQNHIRVLRRHIYSMTGGSTCEMVARNRVLVDTA